MEVEEFRRILAAGLGRTVLYLRDHDDTPYRDVILYACTHNTGYDRQIEGSRADYLFELIQQTSDPQWYRNGILAALVAKNGMDELDLSQRFGLAHLFAKGGDAEARQAMHTMFAQNVAERDDDMGADEIVELDGLDGFIFVADCLGRRLLVNPEAWSSDFALSLLEKKIGKDKAMEAVNRAATENPTIATYLSAVLQRRAGYVEAGGRSQDIQPYDEVKQIIVDPRAARRTPSLLRWGQRAPDNEVMRAACDLLKEEDPTRLHGYLLIFSKRPFPLAPEKLIALASRVLDQAYDARTADINARAALQAWNVLQLVTHPSVRAFALRSMQSVNWADRAVGLLISNFANGDHLLIEECLARYEGNDWVHDVGFDALKVFEANPTSDSITILNTIYERGPCSVCRGRCVEQLIALKQVPAWMAEECRFDANEGIRKRIAKYFVSIDTHG